MGPIPNRTLGAPAAAVLAVLAVLAGCGGSKKKPADAGSTSKPTVTISVAPSKTSNHSRPLHAIVRTVNLKQFAEEPYATVAQLVVSPDESVVAAFVVFPGIDQAVTIDKPAKGALAVYFLFTDATGTTWKQLYDSPPAKIVLELDEDEIVQPGDASSKSGKDKGKSKSKDKGKSQK